MSFIISTSWSNFIFFEDWSITNWEDKWNTVISLHCKYTGNSATPFSRYSWTIKSSQITYFPCFCVRFFKLRFTGKNIQLKNPKSPLLYFTRTSLLPLQSNTWKLTYFETPFEAFKIYIFWLLYAAQHMYSHFAPSIFKNWYEILLKIYASLQD